MNAWQITLTALATIAGLCAFGFGLVAMIQATNAAGVSVSHTAERTVGSKVLTVLVWAAYVFVLLPARMTSGILSQIASTIILIFGALFCAYAIIQMWRVRTARNWAFLATGCTALTIATLYLAFR